MLLYLLRHAIAQDRAASDEARELTEQGVAQARSVADKFSQYAPLVDRVLCSPYTRAQQTASYVMPLFPDLELTIDEGLKPGADLYALLERLEAFGDQRILLVGHNPFLSHLLSLLVDGTIESRRHADNATLYSLSLDIVAPGCGELLYTLNP